MPHFILKMCAKALGEAGRGDGNKEHRKGDQQDPKE